MTTKPTERGFTMIEVMIAITLSAIAVMGIVALYITETRASGYSRHTTEAAVLAEDMAEWLRGGSASFTGSDSAAPETGIDERAKPGGIFKRIYYETTGANFATITVDVTWAENGQNHKVEVISRRKP